MSATSSTRLCPGASRGVVGIATCAFSGPGGLGRGTPAPSPGNWRLGWLGPKRRVQGRRDVHRDIASAGPIVAAVRRAVTGAVARAPQGRHGLRCREALPAPHGRPIAQAPAGDSDWRATRGVGRRQPIPSQSRPLPAERRAEMDRSPHSGPRRREAKRGSAFVTRKGTPVLRPLSAGPGLHITAQRGRNVARDRTPGTPLSVDGHAVPEVGGVT